MNSLNSLRNAIESVEDENTVEIVADKNMRDFIGTDPYCISTILFPVVV